MVDKKIGNFNNVDFLNNDKEKELKLPLLPLKDLAPFPDMVMPIFVGREKSVKAIEYANALDKDIFLVTQKDSTLEDIEKKEDLEEYGVIAEIKQVILLQDRTLKVLLECKSIAFLEDVNESEISGMEAFIKECYRVYSLKLPEERQALQKSAIEEFDKYLRINKNYDINLMNFLSMLNDSFEIAYYIAERININRADKQKILSIKNESEILEFIILKTDYLIKVAEMERKIRNRLKNQIEKNQKDYYLTEQIKAIQKELGEGEDVREEITKLESKIHEVKLSDHARMTAMAELKKMKYINQFSAEFSVIKNYLDFLLDLPWQVYTEANTNLEQVKKILDSTHFGIKEVKERVYELIVQKNRVKDQKKSTILCFYGSPGIGKTSFAYSIGEAMGLKTISIPLGGVKDEAVLRGHRRTYIGSMPGRIIQALKDAGSSNLVIVLDEIGSIGSDWRGNPEDVLLEILDPMQNKNFQDNYLATGFDLSGIIFVATTNYIDTIKPALLDRLEVIHLTGYTQEEKEIIAKDYIIPKLLIEYGLTKDDFSITQKALDKVIRNYTYESGVRGLEKQLSKLIRKAMCNIEEKKLINVGQKNDSNFTITEQNINEILKKPVYLPEKKRDSKIGTVYGLAFVGGREGQEGEVLVIESCLVPGDGKTEFTGQLGDEMKESVQVAYKNILSKAEYYDLNLDELSKKNIYVNFPSGGTPKNGPSAGVAIFCSMFSTIKKIEFPNYVAMTGEISLGSVMKVGGIKEKLLAAYRNEIKKVFIPEENEIDLQDVPEEILKKMEIILINQPEDVLKNLGLL